MSRGWALRLSKGDVASVGRLRCVEGLEVCEVDDGLWLRGETGDETLQHTLLTVPAVERYAILDDGQLRPLGARVPCGYLPDGPWVAAVNWLNVGMPSAGLAGLLSETVRIRLVRCSDVVEPSLLTTGIDQFAAYAACAPQVRLDRWHFAVGDDGRVVVRGRPVPPLIGRRYVERGGVCVPAGWHWEPAVESDVMSRLLGLDSNDVAILETDGRASRLSGDDFVRASRSAIRKSAEAFSHA